MVDIINRKITNYSSSEIVFNMIDVITKIVVNDVDEGINLLKGYNITFEEFDKFIKHSTVDYKKKYNNKTKLYIKKNYSNLNVS